MVSVRNIFILLTDCYKTCGESVHVLVIRIVHSIKAPFQSMLVMYAGMFTTNCLLKTLVLPIPLLLLMLIHVYLEVEHKCFTPKTKP